MTSENSEIFRFSDIQNPYVSRMFPYVVVFFEIHDKYGAQGSTTGPKNVEILEVPKSIWKVVESIMNR